MIINSTLTVGSLQSDLQHFWNLSGQKIRSIDREFDTAQGAPVFTEAGKYTTRGWTEWTEGFVYGSALLQYEATGDEEFLTLGRSATRDKMASHLTHFGVHDHGFNNLSTYGNLLRLMHEGKIPQNAWEKSFYELAIKVSGAVQASRWTSVQGGGYIYSFNGPHSLFIDTMRSLRILVASHLLGHSLKGESDQSISLLERALVHARTSAAYAIWYGEGRDTYDVRGRTAHESIFNTNDGMYRCPGTQQGYSGFSTWTRGLAWAMLGYAEQLEFLRDAKIDLPDSLADSQDVFLKAAMATCDFYIEYTPTDGIPYWDTGAPGLVSLGDIYSRASDPYNAAEPIDSSAACIGAQGLLRLGSLLGREGKGQRYWQAGLTAAKSLFQAPYLSDAPDHQGLILHAIYHQPNGWDYVPEGASIAQGESCMWGDYHARELAIYLHRELQGESPHHFFNGLL
ncbi:MAG: glycoside hydrolase family 88 protein [Saprospiraceae bacterium]|nr:glycoside hydrolase family 88 protein [Saprospiraceae bacterium]